ncbi:hypothetical protein [Limnohabitans sp. Bal53]|nr:hypothetical protein [Limnohabitans sp. Bal53]
MLGALLKVEAALRVDEAGDVHAHVLNGHAQALIAVKVQRDELVDARA